MLFIVLGQQLWQHSRKSRFRCSRPPQKDLDAHVLNGKGLAGRHLLACKAELTPTQRNVCPSYSPPGLALRKIYCCSVYCTISKPGSKCNAQFLALFPIENSQGMTGSGTHLIPFNTQVLEAQFPFSDPAHEDVGGKFALSESCLQYFKLAPFDRMVERIAMALRSMMRFESI